MKSLHINIYNKDVKLGKTRDCALLRVIQTFFAVLVPQFFSRYQSSFVSEDPTKRDEVKVLNNENKRM